MKIELRQPWPMMPWVWAQFNYPKPYGNVIFHWLERKAVFLDKMCVFKLPTLGHRVRVWWN
jgi:hypothetical protein